VIPPVCLILGSDYRGELNARRGVAEWLGARTIEVSIAEATRLVEAGDALAAYRNVDVLLGGTGEETTQLLLELGKKIDRSLTVFLASILPEDLHPAIHQYDLIAAPPHPKLSAGNVLPVLGVAHRFRPSLFSSATLPNDHLKIALLVGGNTRYCNGFTPELTAGEPHRIRYMRCGFHWERAYRNTSITGTQSGIPMYNCWDTAM